MEYGIWNMEYGTWNMEHRRLLEGKSRRSRSAGLTPARSCPLGVFLFDYLWAIHTLAKSAPLSSACCPPLHTKSPYRSDILRPDHSPIVSKFLVAMPLPTDSFLSLSLSLSLSTSISSYPPCSCPSPFLPHRIHKRGPAI